MALIDTLLSQLIADRDAMKSALNGIFNVSVGDSLADYATSITTVGNQLEGMLGMNQEFSIDLTGSGLTAIRGYLFRTTKITSIVIPATITNIEQYAFNNCTLLTSANLPNSLTNIGNSAFSGCNRLTSVTIPSGVATLGTYIYQNCTSLTSVVLLNNIVGFSMFHSCTGMTNAILGDGITTISNGAFYGCTHLESITIYATTPPTLGDPNAFSNANNCPIYVPEDSVAAYKAASNWNSLSSRIQAIPT